MTRGYNVRSILISPSGCDKALNENWWLLFILLAWILSDRSPTHHLSTSIFFSIPISPKIASPAWILLEWLVTQSSFEPALTVTIFWSWWEWSHIAVTRLHCPLLFTPNRVIHLMAVISCQSKLNVKTIKSANASIVYTLWHSTLSHLPVASEIICCFKGSKALVACSPRLLAITTAGLSVE